MIPTRPAALMPAGCLLLGLSLLGSLAVGTVAADQPSDKDIAALIEQLGDPDFTVRDRAQEKLSDLGETAYNALTLAANHPDLEISARARYLLRTIKMPLVRDTDSERVKNTLAEYADLATEDQLLRVRVLMALPEGQGYPAACRLTHIENSVIMSKYIATTILNRWPVHAKGQTRMREAVEAELAESGRKAAHWLLAYARLDSDPKAGLDRWRSLLEEERLLLPQRSPKSSEQVVAALLYTLADAETRHGEPDLAQEHFAQAQQQKLTYVDAAEMFYRETARFFQTRGKIDWAVEVYGQIMKLGDAAVVPLAQLELAELFHDAGRDGEAAAALEKSLELFGANRLTNADSAVFEQVRGRMHFFRACQAKAEGNMEQHRARLLEAVKTDPNELDSLIALYRLPDLDEATRKKTLDMIDEAAELLRQAAEASPDNPSTHNEYAWVVGNTTGDMQEALKHALQAVELDPESGAYLDTLAHVYFYGLKEYDKAAEAQAKAVEFTPHSRLIQRQYELFRKTASEQKSR